MSTLFCRDEDERLSGRHRRQPYSPPEIPCWRASAWCPEEESPNLERSRTLSHLQGFFLKGDVIEEKMGEEDSLQGKKEDSHFEAIPMNVDSLHKTDRPGLEAAATRIQAHVRGRRTRINQRVSVQTAGAASSQLAGDGGASASSGRRKRSVSFAGENQSPPRTPTGAEPDSKQAEGCATPCCPGGKRKTCTNGHRLKGPAQGPHAVQRRCQGCKRCFIGEAKMWGCRRCNFYICQACHTGSADSSGDLKPGARVQLCGMNNQLLNCMNGYIQGRADQNRYTVLISELGDTITLPARNIEEQAAAADSDLEGGSETSSSEIFDSNHPDLPTKARKRSITQRALSTVRAKSVTFFGQVVRMARSIVGENVNVVVGGLAEAISPESSMPLLEAWWEEKKRLAKEQLLQVSAPMRKRMLENIGTFVKDAAMRDPDMWHWVRPVVKSAVAGIWDDIEVEIESNIEVALTDQRSEVDLHAASCSSPGPRFRQRSLNRWGAWYLRMRAYILFHYLPYNKTFFGKLKDPVYDVLVAMTVLPLFGVRFFFFSVLLFMLVIPGPADEYQLVNYILHFKGTMFFTSGVIMLFIGAMEYNRCYMFFAGDIRSCIENSGPGANEWLCTLVLDYLGSITLVWVAWLALPYTRKFPSHVERMRGWTKREEARSPYCCCLEGVVSRGGRLAGLLSYDVICFVLSFTLMASFCWASTDSSDWDFGASALETRWRHAKAVVYWCQVLYALFSLPFALFVVPVFSWLLTHSTFTGFNQSGACVEFAFPVIEMGKEEIGGKSP